MPSGKKSKEQRRAAQVRTPPPVKSKGGTRARQASPRALAIGGGVVAIVAIVIVLAVVLSGGSSGGGLPKNHAVTGSLANGLPGAADVNAELKGIPQNGTTLGWPFAPVTLTEYIDLQCPVCQEFETTTFPDVVQKYVRAKKVKVVMEPWAFIGPDSYRGQAATIAAARQNKAFDFAALLYDNQGTENTGWLTDEMIYNIAAGIPGLNIDTMFSERKSSPVKQAASKVDADAQANNVHATPAIFVNKSGAKPKLFIEGLPDETKLFAAIDAALGS